ncbi:hypothetical protein GJR98_07015 [Haloferax sp. MBLA0077]|uniref:Uncharacterized protein n=2 Tax=Haloferax TaxID=2251 RepID=A0A6G1Z1R3_9EURY|nr:MULTISPECIES: hypothetical protein [Haloferax]KAB1189231.1 hypothetical protein Hfx1149_07050 [Haloferax sp. CBA1149]MRW80463.1 hypothetical protein [Haloferax marinisediminis]
MQFGEFFAGPLGQILLVLIAIAIVIVVGRMVLKIAWRLVTIAALIIAVLLLLSFFGINVI